jgi:hypothetical protein
VVKKLGKHKMESYLTRKEFSTKFFKETATFINKRFKNIERLSRREFTKDIDKLFQKKYQYETTIFFTALAKTTTLNSETV